MCIRDRLWDYPVQYKNFAADDDSNGPVFFIRALEDCEDVKKFSAQDVAEALLNYAPYEHGFFWWGGYGTSTEHTAYLNLRSGIPAPRSGRFLPAIRSRPLPWRKRRPALRTEATAYTAAFTSLAASVWPLWKRIFALYWIRLWPISRRTASMQGSSKL